MPARTLLGSINEILNELILSFPMILTAVFGCLVKLVNDKAVGDKIGWWEIFARILSSGFVGFLLHLILKDANLSIGWQVFLAGSAGGCANQILLAFREKTIQVIGAVVNTKIHKDVTPEDMKQNDINMNSNVSGAIYDDSTGSEEESKNNSNNNEGE